MNIPQSGIFSEFGRFYHALEYGCDLDLTGSDIKPAIDLAADLKAESQTAATFAFGPKAWSDLSGDRLDGFHPFETISTNVGTAISTQSDLLIWIKAEQHNDVFDLALALNQALGPQFTPSVDLPGFDYRNSHDLIGFEDGTANPKGEDRQREALIPEGEVGAGGAFVLSQKWVHDLNAFQRLPLGEQEGIVGRTKAESIELEGDAMPEDSHVSRTDVKVDGVAMKLWRRSFPFGTVSEKGLYFLAFAKSIERFQVQLDRMYGRTEDGLHDRLIEFSEARTSSYWFAPSVEDLRRVSA